MTCNTCYSPYTTNDSSLRCPNKYDAFCVTYKGDPLMCFDSAKGENLESLLGKFCTAIDNINSRLLQTDAKISETEISINLSLSNLYNNSLHSVADINLSLSNIDDEITEQNDRLDTILANMCYNVRACVTNSYDGHINPNYEL